MCTNVLAPRATKGFVVRERHEWRLGFGDDITIFTYSPTPHIYGLSANGLLPYRVIKTLVDQLTFYSGPH